MPNMKPTDQDTFMRDLLKGRSILIVDDDDDYAEALEEVFLLQGCQVTRGCDPVSALNLALTNEFDLVIVDKNMPRLTGIEFAKQLRNEKPASKIVLITAYPNGESRQESLQVGIRYYLSKPFRKNDLLEIASFLLL